MVEPLTGESVPVTSQQPGFPLASATHLPLAVVAPSIAGVTAAHLSAPASAGKLEALGASAVGDAVQPAASAASATEARILMCDLSLFFVVSGEPRAGDAPAVLGFDELGGERAAFLEPVAALALEARHPLERGVA